MRDQDCLAEHQKPPLGDCTCDTYTRGYHDALDAARGEVAIALMACTTEYVPPNEHNAVLNAVDNLREVK